jgi:succinate dehydrogenase/fumarate reductase flavoprotein subunit
MLPDGPDPDWVIRADSIAELATLIGIDPAALQATTDRFNDYAAKGEDPDFDRHRKGLMGPGRVKPLAEGPFYAVRIYPGMLGTNGGPMITKDAEVRRQGGGVINGLYAAGNTAANVFGWAYPSGGGTIGNGTVFGYRAGIHAGSRPDRDIENAL